MSKDVSKSKDIELYDALRLKAEGWDAAFAELYRRYAPQIYAYCGRILDDDEQRDDVFQETFLRFYRCAEEDRPLRNIHAYLLRIARNLSYDAKKKQRQAPLTKLPELPVEEQTLENKELAGLIDMALELLPEEQREAFILQSYHELSYKEIALLTDVPITTVRNRVVRARRKVRESLKPFLADYRS